LVHNDKQSTDNLLNPSECSFLRNFYFENQDQAWLLLQELIKISADDSHLFHTQVSKKVETLISRFYYLLLFYINKLIIMIDFIFFQED
jgi:hypothetical protein